MEWEDHLKQYLDFLKEKYGATDEQIREAVATDRIPAEAFASELTPLQTAAHALAQRGKNAKDIARVLGRTASEVEKFLATKAKTLPTTGTHPIAASVFANRKHSALEHVVAHLERKGLTVAQIAALLKKAEPTIWTIHYRLAKKGGNANA
jgi:DNA-binding NarL/FixJ family response regulator